MASAPLEPLLLVAGGYQGGDLLDWTTDHGIQEEAFIQRIEALSTMGYSVLLSNYRRYFKLASYLATFTRESIVIAIGLPSLIVRCPPTCTCLNPLFPPSSTSRTFFP